MLKYLMRVNVLSIFVSLGCSSNEPDASRPDVHGEEFRAVEVQDPDAASFAIRNGEEVGDLAVPFMGALVMQVNTNFGVLWRPFCSGSLVNREHFLTAAHCVPAAGTSYRVAFGNPTNTYVVSTSPNASFLAHAYNAADLYVVANASKHPQFDPNLGAGAERDIAVITLSRSAFGIPLPDIAPLFNLPYGAQVKIAGFGDDETQGTPSGIGLRRIGTAQIRAVGGVDTFEIETISGLEQMVCSGDSGGPIYTVVNGRPTIYGITKSGPAASCSIVSWATIAKTSADLPWLYEKLNITTSAEVLDAQRDLVGNATSLNWGGRQEKWISASGAQNVYIMPDGQVEQWDSRDVKATFAQNRYSKIIARISPYFYDDTEALIYGGMRPLSSVYDLRMTYQFRGPTSNFNWGSLQEKWFQGAAVGAWYFILPNGKIYRWDTRDSSTVLATGVRHSDLIGRVDAVYYQNTAQLFDGLDLASAMDRAYVFTGTPQAYNWGGINEWWIRGKVNEFGNSWYFVTAVGEIFSWDDKTPVNRICPCIGGHQRIGRVKSLYYGDLQKLIDGLDL